jgi:hypothetical protein
MLAGGTRVLSVYEGAISIADIIKRDRKEVLLYSFDDETKLPALARIEEIIETSEDCVFDIEFDSGLKVLCSATQEFLTFRAYPQQANTLQTVQSIRAFSMSLHKDGHYRVHGFVNNKPKHQYVARMVWEYFNGKIPKGIILHHKDYNKLNNHIGNFELVSNSLHSSIHADDRRNHKITTIISSIGNDHPIKMYSFILDKHNSIVVADDTPVAGCNSGIFVRS